MREAIRRIEGKDIRLWQLLLAGFILATLRLILCSAQQVYLTPDEGGLDDMLMYTLAQNITEGQWLGPYNWLTLSKHSFFALWLATLHSLGIPYLLGGQLLWTAASAITAWAFTPLLRRRWASFLLFGFLLFNPAAVANPAPFGFVSRVYRDNIFPALCLLCVAGVAGFALRHSGPLRRTLGWLALSGLALGLCYLTREDGLWLMPFLLVGLLVVGIQIVRSGLFQKGLRLASFLLPFAALGLCVGAWCSMNYLHYGRFIVSDFSAHEFADAYGALVRVNPQVWEKEYAVPEGVRLELYEKSPSFGLLRDFLENPAVKDRYGNHRSGGFYWALREAAAVRGFYDSPEASQTYFTQLAQEINALCEQGEVIAGPQRSGVTPPFDIRQVPHVAKEWVHSLSYCATFRGCDPRSLISPGVYDTQIAPMEAFLRESALQAYQAGTSLPYYSLFDRLCYFIFDVVMWAYRLLCLPALAAAVLWQCWEGARLCGLLRKKEKAPQRFLCWLLMLGLLFLIFLRAAMIAFVSVTSFQIGTYIMYLASIHPLMILYGFLGAVLLLRLWREHRSKAQPDPAKEPGTTI